MDLKLAYIGIFGFVVGLVFLINFGNIYQGPPFGTLALIKEMGFEALIGLGIVGGFVAMIRGLEINLGLAVAVIFILLFLVMIFSVGVLG